MNDNNNKNSKLINEYVNFMGITRKLQNIHFIQNKKLASKLFDQLFQFIIEDRILYRYKIKQPPYNGYNKIEDEEDLKIINENFENKKKYMEKKGDTQNETYIKLEEIKDYFIHLVNNKHELYNNMYNDTNNDIIVSDEYVKYRKIKIILDNRLKFLLKKAGKKNFVRMILRYVGYGITGQHCAIPINTYKYLYDTFNIRGEGFGSPLNSKLIGMKDTVFCTLFKDTDKYVGSLGPFSHKNLVKHQDKNWTINPPYMPNVMLMTYNETMKAFKKIKRNDFLAIILFPKWTNDEAYIKFKNCKYLVKLLEPPEGEHYMNCNGRTVYIGGLVNSMLFLCRDKSVVTDKKIQDLLKIWNTYEEDTENQSFFTDPEILK